MSRCVTASRSPRAGWAGTALLRPGVLAFSGAIGPTDTHSHHAVQVILADTAITMTDDEGASHGGTRLVVAADTAHRIETGAAEGAIVFLDPDTAAGRAANLAGRIAWPQPCLLAHLELPVTPVPIVAADVVAHFHDAAASRGGSRHPAVTAALRQMRDMIGGGPVRTSDVAGRIGWSTARLTHLFTDQVGLPLRRYVLWLRLMTALRAVADGADLTAAAHAAGFADSAHLTRTCRAMFGLAPSALYYTVQLIVDDV
ncbi:hypothetical protein AWC13_04045 [Mycobacterium kubicae]|nr:hypothetical protein AWC13_04045 [Mycobacterium kubicae]QNI12813.1 AraC family transcriptional regulator [Mycobacterium kubicae]